MRYAQISDIKQLINTPSDSRAISIFLPTHRISLPHNLRADRVRMKNAIRDIVAKLEREGTDPADIKKYVAKLHTLKDDLDFLKHRDNGLAIYAQKGMITYFDLPIEIKSSVHLGKDFIISPLLAGTKDRYNYFVLELNSEQPRFFLANQQTITEILQDVMPGAIEQALRIDEYQQNLQHGTSRGASHDGHHHGHGAEKDNKYKDLVKYYRLISDKLEKNVLKNSSLPLVLAGDSRTTDMYKSIASYKHIESEIIEGNNQRTNASELHQKSWNIMSKRIEAEENLFKRLFEKAKHRDSKQALVKGEHIRKAARQGRVATLGISIVHRTYDSVVSKMERRFKIELPSSKRQLANIENATREVLLGGGDISALLYSEDNSNNNNYLQAITR